ncbi:MAG: hypothetical protein K2M16_07835 [Muribaculaceae bacterium]|nr:hypothetical protein [Muribaculaceae bacterium]
MNTRNLRPALITTSTYLAATLSATGIIAWIATELSIDGTAGIVNAAYIAVLALGLVISFTFGYAYETLLSKSMLRYVHADPDLPEELVRSVCKGRLLSRFSGCMAALSLAAAALTFGLTGETYIELICLLMAVGLTALLLSLNYRSQYRHLLRQRFRILA